MRISATLAFLFTLALCCLGQSLPEPLTWRQVVVGRTAMVSAENPLEALAAARVLQQGGNAFDAAVAAFYMTAVTEPNESGLGGDGFILAYAAGEKRVILINGSGPAPKLATREFYQRLGEVPLEGRGESVGPIGRLGQARQRAREGRELRGEGPDELRYGNVLRRRDSVQHLAAQLV